MVHEELLLHPVPVGLPALLVGRHLRVAKVCEGTLTVGQHVFPLFGGLLAASFCGSRSGALGLHGATALALQSGGVESVPPLFRHTQHRRVVHVAMGLIVGPEGFQRLCHILSPPYGATSLCHFLWVAEEALVSFPWAGCLTYGLRGVNAWHHWREAAAPLRHGHQTDFTALNAKQLQENHYETVS